MNTRINAWLRKYGKTYREEVEAGEYWYNDCNMIDGIMFDLDLGEEVRPLVHRLVDEWIAER